MGKAKNHTLNDQQRIFIAEYIKSRNATDAAIKAGYSPTSAYSIGNENLAKPHIRKEINKYIEKVEKKSLVTVEYIVEGLKEVIERCKAKEEIDAAGANKAYELLGKYLKMFTDRVEVNVVDDLAEKIKEARLRSKKSE